MKNAVLSLLLLYSCADVITAKDLIVYFEDRNPDVFASYEKSTYLLKSGERNENFLIDKITSRQRGNIIAIFNSNISFKNYFIILSYLDRFGYDDLKIYILADDKKSMMQFEIKGMNRSVPPSELSLFESDAK